MIIIITTIINIAITWIVAPWAVYFQKYGRAVASELNNQYTVTTIIVICVEFAALIGILYIVLPIIQSPAASFSLMQSLVHISVRVQNLLLLVQINVRVHNLLLSFKKMPSYICLKY